MQAARKNRVAIAATCALGIGAVLTAREARGINGHFDQFVDPGYNTQIYAGPIGQEGCGAWTLNSHLLTHGGSTIYEYDPVNTSVHQGTNVHNLLAVHNVPGLNGGGVGITNGTDGYLY